MKVFGNNIKRGKSFNTLTPSVSARKKAENRCGFYMVLVPLIGFVFFTVYPMLWVLVTSFFDYDMITYEFCGVENYLRVFNDPGYWQSVWFTIKIVLLTNIIQIPLALFVAILLNSKKVVGKTLFRTVFYMPNIISIAIVGLIFSFLFSSYDGIVNNILEVVGLIDKPISWFSTTNGSTFVVVIVSIWGGMGVNMLFFLSGLAGIPQELYEAAEIDGASKWQIFRNIIWPMLMPMLQIILMLSITSGLKSSDLILTLTNGAPGGTTEVVMTYLLKKFIPYDSMEFVPQLGYASSLGIVTSVIIGIITLVYFRTTKKMGESIY